MTVTIRLPTVLRRLADEQAEVAVEATTAGQALREMGARYPQLGQQLLDGDGNVRPFVKLFVDQEDLETRGGADAELDDGTVLRIIPAIAGGAA